MSRYCGKMDTMCLYLIFVNLGLDLELLPGVLNVCLTLGAFCLLLIDIRGTGPLWVVSPLKVYLNYI